MVAPGESELTTGEASRGIDGAVNRQATTRRAIRSLLACRLAASALLFVGLGTLTLHAQQDEHAVRAAFVYNLTKYVVWPNRTRDIVICFSGNDNMGVVLKDVVDGKESDGRLIHVLLQPRDPDFAQCNILYVAKSPPKNIHSVVERTQRATILTVGEDESFVLSGGMVGLVRAGDQLQIEVNLEAVRANGLSMSSRLLDLAVIVRSGRRN